MVTRLMSFLGKTSSTEACRGIEMQRGQGDQKRLVLEVEVGKAGKKTKVCALAVM